MLALVLFATAACAGARPTLTDDVLVTAPAATPDLAIPQDQVSPDPDDPGLAETFGDDPSGPADPENPAPAAQSQLDVDVPAGVEQLRVVVEETFPHDPTSFTQGLEIIDGVFLESAGLYEQSDVRRVDLATGEVLARTPTPDGLFAEGLTRVGDRVIQLTWKAGKAYVWDLETLNLLGEFTYDGQGWGLCFNGSELLMTDGSANLTFRNPDTFEITQVIPVQLANEPVTNLNEIECVNSDVYINIWMTDQIVRVDQMSGQVNAVIDASDLAQPRPEGSNVLNGIAYDRNNDVFYLTGKLWPTMHRVRFGAVGGG